LGLYQRINIYKDRGGQKLKIICYMPTNEKENKELKRKVAEIYSNKIIQYIKESDIISEIKKEILDDILIKHQTEN